ncbi:flagellar hook-length control protein FliK [Yersinia massiliensis]|uniref:Flagellar hook-length control protein FliK n=1 Tax=Yersinia massiliensis TaxID=419257 RepID=A0AA91BHF9_9GAMM|nr:MULTISPECIES: flagellar hook-length control protein FliK [Yersinia]MDA5546666.1 flagellar hook-length control protein FliK [Yersinia massiliensis]NIL26286.1 flagellar hook-length control protein FliK [Yersinia massiliensis]OWF74833.1 flagellar hook-length control protein FliK [Yersinia frederiksenii]UZM80759.1 flagellar hook-length control protein FliK [Yersinia massiliensis]CNF57095.1 flagellar hook-length control protein FliK [Yersinia frederiksenii]
MNLSLLPAAATTSETEGAAASSSIAALFTDAGLPADFAKLLGDQLGKELTALDASALKSSLAAKTDLIADVDGGKSSTGNSKLNQLLAALGDISATLPAGLTHAGQTGDAANTKATTLADESAQDKTADKGDLSALQTLLAMLPHQVATTLGSANQGQKVALTEGNGLSGSKTSTKQDLAALTSLTSQDKGLAALIGSTIATAGNGKNDKTASSDPLLAGTAKTKTAQDKLARLTAQSGDSAQTAKVAPLAAQVDTAVTATSALEKTFVSASATSAVLPPVSSPVIATPTSTLVNAPVSGHLSAQLGSQEWQQSLGQQVVMFSRNGQQTAELRLNPQELGALQISLKMEDNQAQLHFASAHSQVRAALEAAMPSLRSALAESGIQLGQSSVGSEGQWQQAQQQSQQNQQSFASRNQPAYGETASTDALASTPLVTPASLQALANGSGGVDIFA